MVTINITGVDEEPTIAGDATIDYAENGTGEVETFTAMDLEEATISWSLEGTDADVFDISTAGVLTFKESPDYEMPADADTDNTYMVTVKANDGAYEVAIMVTDVDEVPTIAGDATIDYAENGTGEVETFTAMDLEEATISWSVEGTDADVFDISTAGVLTFKESPDYEMPADADTDNTYMVTVKANDGAYEVAIMVTDVDEVPTIAGDATIDYAENGTGEVETFTAMDLEEPTR
jgi:serralysin